MKNNSQIIRLLNLVSQGNLSYNNENKEKFKKIGTKAMRRLASALKLKEFEVRFNPGGIAVGGDLYLHGMFNDHVGIYINISEGCFMYRTVKNMKDCTGGSNNFFTNVRSETQVVNEIYRLCNITPSELKTNKRLSERDLVKPGKSIEQFTGNRRKDYQERYDKVYEAFQKHFMYGNYFRVNENSHDRIHDLTLSVLAFENMVMIKGAIDSEEFLNTKFKFPSNNEGRISALIECYRPEMWELFSELAGYVSEELC